MRYLAVTYYRKANGQIDEALEVTNRLKNRDLQCANVILDFKTLQVIKCSVDGQAFPRDFDRAVVYYRKHYRSTIDRLLAENGRVIQDDTESINESKNNTD